MKKIIIIFLSQLCLLNDCKLSKKHSDTSLVQDFYSVGERNNNDIALKNVYRDYFPVGTAVYYGLLQDKQRRDFIAQNYSSLTPEVEMKPSYIHPEKERYAWAKADSIVAFAQQNDMKVRGHCLIWFYRMPAWFTKDDNGNDIRKEELFIRMENHITEVMNHYKGKVYCWDVVNEAVSYGDDPNMFKSDDQLYKIAGEEYIEWAFRIARKVDPNVKLFYNDNQFDNHIKRKKIYTLLKKLKEKGVPIDGVGFQGHYGINGISERNLKSAFNLFSELGLEIQITELDISIFERWKTPQELKDVNPDYQELEERQAQRYKLIFDICRENKKCTGITLWGAADWRNYLYKKFQKNARPYLFDENMKPKKAFYSVVKF